MVALGKNFAHSIPAGGMSIFGAGGLIPVPGNIYFVDQLRGSDANRGDKPTRALATLSKAHSLMTANQNDTVLVIGSTTEDTLAAIKAWSKGRTARNVALAPVTAGLE